MTMRRFMGLLVLAALVCMAFAGALAADVHETTPADFQARFDTSVMPDALEVSYQYETGRLTVVIDAEKTDFQALRSSLDGLSGKMIIEPPKDGKNYTAIGEYCGGVGYTDMDGMVGFATENSWSGEYSTWVSVPGVMDTSRNIFIPEDEEGGTEYVLCWFADDGSKVYEHFIVRVIYKQRNPEPVYLPLVYVTAEMLAPMQQVTAGSDGLAGCVIKDGQLHLTLQDFWGEKRVPLVLNAPAGAASAEIAHDWYGTLSSASVENGQVTLQSDQSGSRGLIYLNNNRMAEDNNYMVTWKNAAGGTLDEQKLNITILPYDAKPLFTYAQASGRPQFANLTPVQYDASNPSASSLKILNNAKNCSVETRYDQETGTLHISREPDAPANGTPGGITAYVTPQDPSYCYARVSSVGGSVIMGNGKYDMAYEDLQWFNLQKVGGNGIEVFTEVPLVRYKAGPVEVYLQEWYWPYGGGAYLIAWYTEEDTTHPAKLEYIHSMVGQMYVESKGELKNQESDIVAEVNKITLVKPDKYKESWDGWELMIRLDPQYGLNAAHYEIYAVNHTGAYEHVSLEKGEEMILYMPYPEGKDMNSPENFYLYHFNTKYVQQEKLLGEKTPFGLKYVIRSMSPFVLEWTPEAEVTPVPQTGDSEPLGLWTALLLASAAFALLMLRRKHA